MKVLFLPRYGPLAGSSRYMTYDYIPYFRERGFKCTVSPFQDDRILLDRQARGRGEQSARSLGLLLHVIRLVLTRIWMVFTARQYDVVVLEKDLFPNAPYALEWLLFKLNPRIVSLYDEATHVSYEKRNGIIAWLTKGKIERIIRNSAHVVVWNLTMKDFVQTLNPHNTVVTSGINLERYQVRTEYENNGQQLRIGWIGTASGFRYIREIEGALAKVAKEYPIRLLVISSEDYDADGVLVENRRWSLETEIADLRDMDIGIMPLSMDEWSAGKSGCKMLQYMGVAVPVVVSPVGINAAIVQDGENGFLAITEEEWVEKLSRLIEDSQLRAHFGRVGRQYVEQHNSQDAIASILGDVLASVARG